jgi:DNA-nicking Smr family endonuclease
MRALQPMSPTSFAELLDPPPAEKPSVSKSKTKSKTASHPLPAPVPPDPRRRPSLPPMATIEPRLRQRLRRGRTDVERAIDLHGLRQDEGACAASSPKPNATGPNLCS